VNEVGAQRPPGRVASKRERARGRQLPPAGLQRAAEHLIDTESQHRELHTERAALPFKPVGSAEPSNNVIQSNVDLKGPWIVASVGRYAYENAV
jgi:hypothetical protein